MAPLPFADRLTEAVRRKRTPVMVGIDPRLESLPDPADHHVDPCDFAAVAASYHRFATKVLDAIADIVPIVKFQAAFFEAVGPVGMRALADLMKHARSRGLLVVLDGKRNDIGSTAQAYAEAYLGGPNAPWPSDALTVNAFLGRETIDPFLRQAVSSGAGIFVLVRTSNPGSTDLQHLMTDGTTVSDRIAGWVESASKKNLAASGFGPVGAVVGATHRPEIKSFRELMPHAILLLPGYGAQGATAADIQDAFLPNGLGAVVNNSRGILFAHKLPDFAASNWIESVRAATEHMIEDLATHTPAGNLS